MAAAFTLTDVSLHYSEKQLLSHISITISEGDKIGVVGRNGAGKSTLCACWQARRRRTRATSPASVA